jgi:TctA family transporter
MGEAAGASFHLPHRSRRMDRALRSLFVFDGPVHGLDHGLHLQELLTGLFGLAALIGTSEHFNKRSALLDQSRSRLLRLSVCSSLIIASHGPSLGRLSGATIAYHVVDKLMIVPKIR